MVDPEVGNEVPDGHVSPAKGLAEVEEGSSDDGETDVAQQDKLGVLVLIQRAARVKVVDATSQAILLALATALTLALVEVVAGSVGDEVHGPTNELLSDKHDEAVDGGLLSQLAELVDETTDLVGELLAGAGQENHVPLHVAGGLVVLAVGDLPAEVGDQESRVDQPAGAVADQLGGGEGAMATLVGNDPETGAKETLDEGVHGPESSAGGERGDVLGRHVCVEDVEGGGEAGNISQDVSPASEGGALEAVLGNGIVDVLDGVVGRGEVVAVCVDETAKVGGLGVVNLDGGERRKRRGRGRRARRVGRRDDSRGLGVGSGG